MTTRKVLTSFICLGTIFVLAGSLYLSGTTTQENSSARFDYLLLATKKTSTLHKELNQAAAEGFRIQDMMGGGTAFGGDETVVIMNRPTGNEGPLYEYKLLSTNKTSTMQKELNKAGQEGWMFRGHTSKKAVFRGAEIISIMERPTNEGRQRWEYQLLATRKTSTMRKEIIASGEQGYEFVGMIVTKTRFGGSEVVSIMQRPSQAD